MKIARLNLLENKTNLDDAIKNTDAKTLLDISQKLKSSASTSGFFILLQLTDQMGKQAQDENLLKIGIKIQEEIAYLLENIDSIKL